MTKAEQMHDSPTYAMSPPPHIFHIPVMGTGFTIDTPLRVARYGISSVVSLIDDVLIEQMRKFHSEREDEAYEPINDRDDDARARRITAYLNLLDLLVRRQAEALQASPFEPDSEITRYYELLPDSPLKQAYTDMLTTAHPAEKVAMQNKLRGLAVPGTIDVNIMTKLDRAMWSNGKPLPPELNDAMSALRGFAMSTLSAGIVMSAGINLRLYSYMAKFDDFLPDRNGILKKRIILKVSDYRSGIIQGQFLAKRGLWVSEYRVESGLNCGGHAFATKGHLIGPILEEFKTRRHAFLAALHVTYAKALLKMDRQISEPLSARVTVQCGLSTAAEHDLMLQHYSVDGTGWGTPFLLVPDATNVDDDTLTKLAAATDEDVFLSDSSPLEVPFWLLRNSQAENERRRRIAEGKPGANCPKRYARSNTEFTDLPICIASHAYIKRKLAQLSSNGLSEEQVRTLREIVLSRTCACHELGGGVTQMHHIHPSANALICPGPNIADFSRIASLKEMIDHIYGRATIMSRADRPHMFAREIRLYLEHLRKELNLYSLGLSSRTRQHFQEFRDNLLSGLDYYARLAKQHIQGITESFVKDVDDLRNQLERLTLPPTPQPCNI